MKSKEKKAILCDMVHVDTKINVRYENKNANSLGYFVLRCAITVCWIYCRVKIKYQ